MSEGQQHPSAGSCLGPGLPANAFSALGSVPASERDGKEGRERGNGVWASRHSFLTHHHPSPLGWWGIGSIPSASIPGKHNGLAGAGVGQRCPGSGSRGDPGPPVFPPGGRAGHGPPERRSATVPRRHQGGCHFLPRRCRRHVRQSRKAGHRPPSAFWLPSASP